MKCSFSAPEQLSPNVWKIVQDDPYKQYPMLYVIKAVDKVILIDTGCPVSESETKYREFVDEELNREQLPYEVICSHVHFDHVGGNCHFCNDIRENGEKYGRILMGGTNKTFTSNYELNSLASAHGTRVPDFAVDRWLEDGDKIMISEDDDYLEVISTPGHTPDSICLFYQKQSRVFVGDIIYPYTSIHIDGLGSSTPDYVASLLKLKNRIFGKTDQQSVVPDNKHQIDAFFSVIGLTPDAVSRQFSVSALLSICDNDVEQAVNMYLTNQDDISGLCPPDIATDAEPPMESEIVLSCGHVESNLPATSINQVLALVNQVQAGAAVPSMIDDGYGEYTDGTYSIMMKIPTSG
eukprot:TRINITY_DN4224_c0_g1_i1.p1 TRINITY_DN4224_c0_g1~~TRINITY_DN4224_c0_g1_i1.p1  ORF type:complete len:351 (+),score=40.51 TRINITY_DN4224_c0_g1_i1:38-1090(+)